MVPPRPGKALLALLTLACHGSTPRADVRTRPASASSVQDSGTGHGDSKKAERGDAGVPGAPLTGPGFQHSQQPLSSERQDAMRTANVWRPGCPVSLDALVLLRLSHWNFEGKRAQGELVVAREVAPSAIEAFRALYELGFPIEQMRPIEAYGGSDDASMAANNTSAFNCRKKTGGRTFSRHAYGTAIDVNPLQNPYVRGKQVFPPAGARYVERKPGTKGLILRGPVTRAFTSRGWEWGGDWATHKDYQHFESR